MAEMETKHASAMGKCSCNLLHMCSDIQSKIVEDNETLRLGHYTIKNSDSPKIIEYRKRCVKWLGIPKNLLNYHIRKHHFSMASLKFLQKTGKYVTTPISRNEVLQEGLQDSVESYKRNTYFIIPNTSLYDAKTHSPSMLRRQRQLRERCKRISSYVNETRIEMEDYDIRKQKIHMNESSEKFSKVREEFSMVSFYNR